jgi:signal transduction histidine kinase
MLTPPVRRERVLIVEDDAVTAAVVSAAVAGLDGRLDTRADFEAHCVSSLGEAREALRREGYVAVLLDLSLPDSEGLATLHALLEVGADCAIIVLTALDDSAIALEAVRLGAQDYLFKGRVDPTLIIRSLLYSINRHRAERQLRQAQQMEALGRLAGGVAHDFNNLLTVIIGNAEAIESDAIDASDVPVAVGEIRQAARRAAALTQRLLALGRQQQFQPRVLDIADSVQGMEPVLRRLLGADITFALALGGGVLGVKVDPAQIEQLILNLVLNARDAVRPGGHITLEVGPIDVRDAEAWKPRLRPGRYIGLTVRDDGTGIPPEVQSRMFEPFVTTKAPGKGTGLGLSIVFGIVQQSDGAIRCDSAAGQGTTFTIALPQVGAPTSATLAAAGTPTAPAQGEVILLVEDEPAVRSLTRRILERHGYTVIDAATGDEALAIFEREGSRIQLVLTDVVMPGLRGPELVAELERRRPGLPVLFMSGYADDDLVRRGVFPEHVAFLKKPFTHHDLLEIVRQHLERGRPGTRTVASA